MDPEIVRLEYPTTMPYWSWKTMPRETGWPKSQQSRPNQNLIKLNNIRHNLGRLVSKGWVDKNTYKRFRNKVTRKLIEATKKYKIK